jgi:hypothetical protein
MPCSRVEGCWISAVVVVTGGGHRGRCRACPVTVEGGADVHEEPRPSPLRREPASKVTAATSSLTFTGSPHRKAAPAGFTWSVRPSPDASVKPEDCADEREHERDS